MGMKTEQAERLREEIIRINPIYDGNGLVMLQQSKIVANEITAMFIAHAIERLVKAGFEPGGKAVKVIEGMRDE